MELASERLPLKMLKLNTWYKGKHTSIDKTSAVQGTLSSMDKTTAAEEQQHELS